MFAPSSPPASCLWHVMKLFSLLPNVHCAKVCVSVCKCVFVCDCWFVDRRVYLFIWISFCGCHLLVVVPVPSLAYPPLPKSLSLSLFLSSSLSFQHCYNSIYLFSAARWIVFLLTHFEQLCITNFSLSTKWRAKFATAFSFEVLKLTSTAFWEGFFSSLYCCVYPGSGVEMRFDRLWTVKRLWRKIFSNHKVSS